MKWNVQLGLPLQPFVDLGRLVRGNVVEDDVNLGFRLDPLGDKLEEGEEVLRAVTCDHLAGDLAGGDVESRHQAGGAVALVVMGAGLGMAGLHRQGRLRPSQRLDLCLLVHRDDHSVVGRVDVEADDVADLQLEPRVAGDLECLHPVGLEAMALQDAEHGRDGDPHFRRQRPQRPVTGVRRRRRHRKLDQFADLVLGNRLAAPSPGDVVQEAVNTLGKEAVPPAPDRRLRHAGGPHRLRQGEAVAEVKDDGRPLHMLEDRMGIGFDPLETLPVMLAEDDPGSPALCHSGSAPV